jgi:hypothetical protein
MKSALATLGLAALVLLRADAAAAEVFALANGGQVSGELLNPDQSPRTTFVIRTTSGVEVTLGAADVVKRLEQSPAEIEYEKIKNRYPDTAEGQWELAEWCAENRLPAKRKLHLERVIALDPNHKRARAALGYSQIDGKWRTQEEEMTSRGYRRYQGRWRTAQEIEVIEAKQKQEMEEKAWYAKIKRWSGWLGGDKAAEARREFAAITDADTAAVKALAALLERDRRVAAQNIYIEALARIGNGDALEALAVRSIEDPVEEVRLTCLDHLKKEKHPEVVAYYVGKLKNQKDNRVVNLAAVALGQTGDASCVGPLIDALVTEHKFKVTTGGPGQTSASFGTGGTGLSAGSNTKIVSTPMQNQAVLDALIALTRVNYNFDVPAWKSWYAAQRKQPAIDARRD